MQKKLGILILLLVLMKATNGQESKFKITYEENRPHNLVRFDQTTFTTIIIKDEFGYPMNGLVSLLDKKKNKKIVYLSDEKGIVKFYLVDISIAKFLSIGGLGYHPVIIPISDVKFKDAIIEVNLAGQTTQN